MKYTLGLTFCSFICFSLTPKIDAIGECIDNQLNTRHSELGEWFRLIELPRVAAFFIPLLKKWSMEYAGRFAQIISSFLVHDMPLGLLS